MLDESLGRKNSVRISTAIGWSVDVLISVSAFVLPWIRIIEHAYRRYYTGNRDGNATTTLCNMEFFEAIRPRN